MFLRVSCVVVALATVCVVVSGGDVPEMTFQSGTHYELGVAMGKTMADLITSRYSQNTDLPLLRSWAATDAGKQVRHAHYRYILVKCTHLSFCVSL